MITKITKIIKKKLSKTEEKPILTGYADFCIKCRKDFKEEDNFIGAFYSSFIDLDVFGTKTASVYTLNEYIVVATEKKRKVKNDSQEVAICHKCLNEYINDKKIVYDGYDHIYTPEDFFLTSGGNYERC